MNIMSKIKFLLLGAAILPTVLWAKPGDPLTFKAIDQRTYVQLSVPAQLDPQPVFEYRSGESGEWRPYSPAAALYVNAGETVSIRAATNGVQSLVGGISQYGVLYEPRWSCSFLTLEGRMEASGDVTTLLSRQGVSEVPDYAFHYLFRNCKNIVTAPDLPAGKLGKYCCREMFSGCEALTNAPVLAATELGEGCYLCMFCACSGLTAAPALPARKLAASCYYMMFSSCTALETPPTLPATELAESCYRYMFQGCTSLKSAPALPATELAESCYSTMFCNCVKLTAAPVLPATELAKSCYGGMFSGCRELTDAPVLPATKLAESCYGSMFFGCCALTTAPVLPATTMEKSCYSDMFKDCSGLLEAPSLPAKTLHVWCYAWMFSGCTSLTRAPDLPSVRVQGECYAGMFSGCTGLTDAPFLPAPDLFNADGCYVGMFSGCTSLTNVTLMAKNEEPAFWSDYFGDWLSGVAPQGTIRCPASLLLPADSASGVPEGWVRETIVPPSPISGVEESYAFVAGAPIDPIVPNVAEGWSVKVTGLPSGLKAASNTGVVSGKPTKAGTFQVTFTATKSGEDSVSVATAITVWQTYAVTFGAAGMRAEASDAEGRFAPVSAEGAKGTKLAAVGNGQTVTVTAPETSVDKKGNELVFQKWMVSPSSVVLSGEGCCVQSNAVSFLMPEANVTLTPTYVEAAKCGWLTAYGSSDDVVLGWNGDTHEYDRLFADENDMQWSPDGGKTWYASGERAMLTAGRYTVQWRSTSPLWAAPKDKEKVEVKAGEDVVREDYSAYFSFVPNVVVDLQTPDSGTPEGCSATMNPKDGRVPGGKSVTLTAKPSKDYAFQGWYLKASDYWDGVVTLESTSASFKLVNELDAMTQEGRLEDYVDSVDYKVHVIAQFKAIADYRQEDLIPNFNGIGGTACSEVGKIDDEHVELTVHGMTGCALDYDIETGEAVWPLTFKQTSGKLPKGLKFDAKKGKISGTPTAKDGESVSCVFTLTDPAKNVLNVTVNFEIRPLRDGLAGDYRALVHLPDSPAMVDRMGHVIVPSVPGKPDGLLEMSVTTAGKVSAKIFYEGGSVSFSGTLAWHPDETDPALSGSMGVDLSGKKNAALGYSPYLDGVFNEDGTMSFDWDVADYCWGAGRYLLGEGETAYRQDKDLYAMSAFREKYYTFAFGTTNAVDEANPVEGGYGYLTVKTDKKGVAKVVGKLPDGAAVSANALVLPFAPTGEEATAENITARLFFFNVPSAYKKQGWCAMDLALDPSGKTAIGLDLSDPQAAAWFQASTYQPPASAYCYWDDPMYPTEWEIASSLGAFYSPAATLTNYYWYAVCPADDRVAYEYKCKSGSESWNEMAAAQTFDGTLFAVELAGDKKGSVVLREKSPAPWKNAQGEWVYDEDRSGKPITDPSQLSISFTKATGIFSGKTNFYFDYNDGSKDQHQKVSVPYAGVMVDSSDGLQGFGSAVFSNKRTGTYIDYRNEQEKPFTYTENVSLPVTLAQPYVWQE